MKRLILSAVVILIATSSFADPLPDVNEKVLKAFSETFKNVSEVKWNEYDDYYEVNFKRSEVISRVRYDKDGNVLGTTRYYSGENLPPNILARLKKEYPGRSVYGVTEISSEDNIMYSITLEDARKWYTVTSDAFGYLQLYQKFNKADTK
jgi:hypothetical protein